MWCVRRGGCLTRRTRALSLPRTSTACAIRYAPCELRPPPTRCGRVSERSCTKPHSLPLRVSERDVLEARVRVHQLGYTVSERDVDNMLSVLAPSSDTSTMVGGGANTPRASDPKELPSRAISYDKFAKTMESSYKRTFTTGDAVFHQGDAVDGFYIVVSGECSVQARPLPTSLLTPPPPCAHPTHIFPPSRPPRRRLRAPASHRRRSQSSAPEISSARRGCSRGERCATRPCCVRHRWRSS